IGQRFGFAAMVEEFRVALMAELDYRKEARNLVVIGENLDHYERIVVPQPVDDYSTSLVLTMDWISGRNLAAIGPLGRLELDGHDLARALFRAYLDQILIDGFFHADPHPGNVLLTDDGRLALIDMGMVAYLSTRTRETVLRLLMAVSDAEPDACAELVISLGERLEDFDEFAFKRAASELLLTNQDVAFGEAQLG